MPETSNFQKHTSNNPIQKLLIDNFYTSLIAVINKLPIKTVLDVGCGEGFTLSKLKEHHIGTHLEGIDYSEDAISLGKKLYPSLMLKRGDIYNLTYKDNSFDLVLCTEVLEHLKYAEKALTQITRVSKKYVLLSVPNEPWFMLANFLRGKNWERWGNDIEHIQHWSSRSFESFVTRSDLVRGSTPKPIKIRVKINPFPWTMLLCEKST